MAEPRNPSASRYRNAKRLAGAVLCLVAAAALAANAASGSLFTSTGTVSQGATTAGNLYLTIPAAGATNRMTLTADNLLPANSDLSTPWRELAANVTNAGSIPLATLSLATIANTNNHLSGDAGADIKMIVDECSINWTEGGTAAEPTYTCGGTRADVLGCATCGVSGVPVDYDMTPNITSTYSWTTAGSPTLANISLTAGAVNHLRIRFRLAPSAANAAQGQSENVTFTFDGTQRAGVSA